MVGQMFGYITVNKQELKIQKNLICIRHIIAVYAEYCGKKYGFSGQFTLSYDCTF